MGLDQDDLKDLDDDDDDDFSPEEIADFLAQHPEFKGASRTKLKREKQRSEEKDDEDEQSDYEDYEEVTKRRGELYDRQDAEEEKIYLQIDAKRDEASKLYDEANKVWDNGDHDKAKELQAQAKKLIEESRDLKAKAVDLDFKHNEEMFEYVQTEEHKGKERDGTWMDLHGLTSDFAEQKTIDFLGESKSKGISKVEVITGAGHHSGKGGPSIRPKIESRLRRPPSNLKGLSYDSEGNPGAFMVTFA